MAYLREVSKACDRCRTARAMVELVDAQNASHGVYCRRCGEIEEKRLQVLEDRNARGRNEASAMGSDASAITLGGLTCANPT